MKYLPFSLLVVLLVSSINLYASTKASTNASPKFVVLDWRAAIMSSQLAAPKIKALQDHIAKEEALLIKQSKELEKEQAKIQKDLQIMTASEKQEVQEKFMLKVQEYNLLGQEFQKYKMQKEQELLAEMRPKIDKVLADIADEFNYTLVLNKTMVAFHTPENEITELVIKRLDILHNKSAK